MATITKRGDHVSHRRRLEALDSFPPSPRHETIHGADSAYTQCDTTDADLAAS